MGQIKSINQIRYNRRATMGYKGEGATIWHKCEREYEIKGQKYIFTSSDHWFFTPALWRMEWIRHRFEGAFVNVNLALNDLKGPLLGEYGFTSKPPADFCADVMGTLIWGPIGERQFFEHLGKGDRSIHNILGRV